MSLTAPVGVLDGYPTGDGRDEAVAGDGAVRDHWRHVFAALDELGPAELQRRRQEILRLLRNHGVTYHVYRDAGLGPPPAEPVGADAWNLDPIPFLVASDEWADVEQGVAERAELLDVVLRDLYGPRELVRRGLLPPEVVFAHRGFLRPVDGTGPPDGPHLHSYAVDLARGPGGEMWVIGDFTQAPSGIGYALENRTVLSRVFPSLYRDAQVHRLAPFFRQVRATIAAAAPDQVDDPRVVLLTPGPRNETYFEHAHLATNLGYPLVEGADLVVQEGRVWLRALGGLEPVDVIVRRVDAWYCDPVELRGDSRLGVPGLVDVVRRGRVAVVNPLGAGALENHGLLPFLPALAAHVLGRDLCLPAATTWWCGDERGRSHVLANLHDLVVKPIGRRRGRNAVFGWELSAAQLDDLRRFIEARPHQFVGQEAISASTAPTLTDEGLAPRHLVLRAFASARDGSYEVMPGGLARVAPDPHGLLVSNQAGAASKDVWVLTSEPEPQSGFWLQRGPVTEREAASALPSRAAENLFWLGRYAERAEGTIRLVRVVLDRRTEFEHGPSAAGVEVLHHLLAALTRLTGRYPGFVGDGATERLADPEEELLGIVADDERPGSLAFAVRALLEAANAVRDQLSGDTWLVLANVERDLSPLRASSRSGTDRQASIEEALTGIHRSLLALAGLATESMVRDPGWSFMDAGRRLERAAMLTALLRSTVVDVRDTAVDSLVFESVLVASESIITYRRRYRSRARMETLLDLLVLDEQNPRSLAHQLARLQTEVPVFATPPPAGLALEERRVLELATAVRVADTVALARVEDGRRPRLAAFLDDVDHRLRGVSEALDRSHFTHLQTQVQFGLPVAPDEPALPGPGGRATTPANGGGEPSER
jgi:uncharacterized circularly permuted ATP-grasp superfamily protein/uncharacterized alpha-E superfamily protein